MLLSPRVNHRSRLVMRKAVAPPSQDLDFAVNGLRRRWPELSAGTPTFLWQKLAVASILGVLAGAAFVAPGEVAAGAFGVLTLPFALVAAVRGGALTTFLSRRENASPERAPPEEELPRYSLLVPLYREAAVVPDLVNGLCALDYPAHKLDIALIVESGDGDTRAALAKTRLAPWFRVVVVPAGAPRTKPRALNYALASAVGDFVVVYDAEDLPEPDQLRRAARALIDGGDKVGCVQARLDLHNADDSWWARQFTIEYAALFRGVLPLLNRLDFPVPLGGTSNHFRRECLTRIGAWDPFNVTEDADLGVRLARLGYRVAILDSTTWEEAPASLETWLPQRTRWLKGWMQTYLVHMRHPLRLWRDLGFTRFVAFQAVVGGIMLSALVHPWFYVMIAADAADGAILERSSTGFGAAMQVAALINLAAGYVTAMALGAFAVWRAERGRLAVWTVFMPVYWLAMSFAAYRAVYQLASAPSLWEKTEHRARTATPGP